MEISELLIDGFGRVRAAVEEVCSGLGPEQLAWRPGPQANSVAWTLWHLTRVQDDHLAAVAGTEQIWTVDDWAERFALPFEDAATGYGQDSEQVAALAGATAELLSGYHDATFARTRAYLDELGESDLDRVVDHSYDPPVTLGVRLVSVLADDLQHVGQAAYVRGLLAP